MFYQVQLWKGLVMPYVSAHQLKKAEKYNGIWKWTIILLLTSLIVSGFAAYFGIGNEDLSKIIYETSPSKFEAVKILFAGGQMIQMAIVAAILIFFPALIFWVFTDTEYRKLIIVQLLVVGIFLLEKLVTIPLQLYLGLDYVSSPFTLGIIGQYLTDYELISNFLSEISFFSIWTVMIQFKYLQVITEKSKKVLLVIIVALNLFLWTVAAFFSYIKFEVFF